MIQKATYEELENRVLMLEKAESERKKADEELKKSEKRYRKVSELISDWAYSFHIGPTGEANQEWVTNAFYKVTGYRPENFSTPEEWNQIIHPDDIETVKNRMNRLYVKGESSMDEYRIKSKSGKWIWIRDSAEPVWDDTHEKITRIYGVAQVITERKQTGEALQNSEQKYRTLASNIPGMIYRGKPDWSHILP